MYLNIINEDGTPLGFEYPQNPLEEKWSKLYPPTPMPQYSQVCDGYSCMWCGRCPKGENWKVPEEDMEIWEQYQEQIYKYHRVHNPSLFKRCDEMSISNDKYSERSFKLDLGQLIYNKTYEEEMEEQRKLELAISHLEALGVTVKGEEGYYRNIYNVLKDLGECLDMRLHR